MTMPQRIQRRRTAGWRMPEGAIYVGRPTLWGNPWRIQSAIDAGWPEGRAPEIAANYYRSWLLGHEFLLPSYDINGVTYERQRIREHLRELRGRDLACWCPLDQACHADVLLELANG